MIHLNDKPDLKKYNSVEVYLKDEAIHKVTVNGKIEAVDFDNFRLAIKTASEYAVFKIDDVLAVTFM